MFCMQCGKEIANGARFCGHCGVSIDSSPSTTTNLSTANTATTKATPTSQIPASVAQVRPWVRYWARMFDIYLAAIVVGFFIGIANPHVLDKDGSEQIIAIVAVFAWVFIESLFLSEMGTTPGKWLFKIRLIPPSGKKLDYSMALARSFKVWWRGLGIGFPIANFITSIVAYNKLSKDGITSWDKEDGFTIVHERIGPARVIAAVIFFLAVLLLAAANI